MALKYSTSIRNVFRWPKQGRDLNYSWLDESARRSPCDVRSRRRGLGAVRYGLLSKVDNKTRLGKLWRRPSASLNSGGSASRIGRGARQPNQIETERSLTVRPIRPYNHDAPLTLALRSLATIGRGENTPYA